MEHRGFLGSEAALHVTTMVGTGHYPLVQTHGMGCYRGAWCRLWALGDCGASPSVVIKVPPGGSDNGRVLSVEGQVLDFSVNRK